MKISIPNLSLVVLIGPSGSGKSTFARKHFLPRKHMNRMVVHSRVGADGILHITVPLAKADADRDVQVTIDPLDSAPMTQEEWRTFVLSTAASITDPTFVRHGQGGYEHREELP